MFRFSIAVLVSCFGISILLAQPNKVVIKLSNPSFEGTPQATVSPSGWYDCGFPGETPPDIQAGDGSIFSVVKPAHHGGTYLGMVTRDNDTWERVGQRLSQPLEKGKKYKFSIYLCRSESYLSPTKKTPGGLANYTTPVKLKIWGGGTYCDRTEVLGETVPVKNTDWKRFDFTFVPQRSISYITLEAFYNQSAFPYNGNILLDNASDIEEISTAVAAVTKPKDPTPPKPKDPTPTKPKDPTPPKPKDPAKPILAELNKVKVGQVIRVEQITFAADSTRLRAESYPVLDELYRFLVENPQIRLEVGGHTNNLPTPEVCDRLSTNRAEAVVDYLIYKGISADRLTYKGYGKRFPIAPNTTPEGRKKNQRVEIKILSVN